MWKIGKMHLIFLLLMVMTNAITYFKYIKFPDEHIQILGTDLVSLTGEIHADHKAAEIFQAEGDEIAGVEIFFSTYDRTNQGETIISIQEEQTVISHTVIANQDVRDNDYRKIDLKASNLGKGKKYTLLISSEEINEGITAWRDQDGRLVAKIYYRSEFTILEFIGINIFFGIVNYLLCRLLRFLRN